MYAHPDSLKQVLLLSPGLLKHKLVIVLVYGHIPYEKYLHNFVLV